jgi:hypothetical protein
LSGIVSVAASRIGTAARQNEVKTVRRVTDLGILRSRLYGL